MSRFCLLTVTMMVASLTLWQPAGAAAQASRTVGVVEFYTPTPLATYPGVTPERFAADDFSDLLVRAAGGGVMVIPRPAVHAAERAMRWQGTDALHFDRLSALARALGADALIVGRIALLDVSGSGSGGMVSDDGGGPPMAVANVVVQVFSTQQGRIIGEARGYGTEMGLTVTVLVEQVLHEALAPAVQPVVTALNSLAAASVAR